jgi:murein DD-endopeptidase MepM/ murein hydrolase activator NlpD
MEQKKKKSKWRFIRRMTRRYRFVIVNEKTFAEKWSFRLTPLNIFIFFGGGALLIIILTVIIVAWTPLREFIPGYPDGSERVKWIENYQRVDSLEKRLQTNEAYLQRIQHLLRGEEIVDSSVSNNQSTNKPKPGDFKPSEIEKDFREKMEDKVKYSFSEGITEATAPAVGNDPGPDVFFFVPAQGDISRSFSLSKSHLGVDISAITDAPVHAAQEGTVVFAGWTVDGGHEIHIQHSGNLVTIYKHNSYLLKKTGDRLRPGDVIAFVGGTGRLSNGVHLHFEIWHNGVPVDPEKYVVF